MQGLIELQFVDATFDHSYTMEVASITELSTLAFNIKKSEGAENCNFSLVTNAENQATT